MSRAEHRLVNYEGDGAANFYRRASGKRPTDAEGKPLKVVERRKATPRENAQIARAQWSGRPLILLPRMMSHIAAWSGGRK